MQEQAQNRNRRTAFLFELGALATILAIAAAVRFTGMTCIGIADLLPDEVRLGLSAATIMEHKLLVLNYYQASEPPLAQYFPILFMKFLGPAPWVVRLAPACFSLAAVLIIFLAGRRLFSTGAGLAAAGYAALLPNFIYWSGVIYENSYTVLYSAGMLYCHALFLQTRKPRYLYLTAMIAGLGFSTNMIMLYVFVAFLVAMVVSGQSRRYLENKRALLIAGVFFVAGAGLLITYIAASDKLPRHMLERVQAETMTKGWPAFASALSQRLQMAQIYCTRAFWLPFLTWPLVFLTSRKADRSIVFLMVFLVVFLLQSVITWSGMYMEHFTVIIPAAALLIGSLAHIPLHFHERLSTAVPMAAFALILGWSCFCFSSQQLPIPARTCKTALSKELSRTLDGLDPRKTIAYQKDFSMTHWYYFYMKKGIVPDIKNKGITSTECNRFKQCPLESDLTALDSMYFIYLAAEKKQSLCMDHTNGAFNFDNPVCAQGFKDLILFLVDKAGYDNFILRQNRNSSTEGVAVMSRSFEYMLDDMEKAGDIAILGSRQVRTQFDNLKILRVQSTGRTESQLQTLPEPPASAFQGL